MLKKVMLVLLLGLCISSNLIAQDINWEIQTDKKIHWMESFQDSLLIVGAKNKISAYQSSTGEIVWEINDFKSVDKSRFTQLYGTDKALIVQHKQNFPDRRDPIRNKIQPYLIAIPSGEIIANYETMDFYHSLGIYRMPNDNLLLYAYNRKKEISLRVLDIQDGSVLWIDSLAYKKEKPKVLKQKQSNDLTIKTIIGNQPPVFDSDSTMIILDDKKYVRKWNFHTGEILWRKEFKQRHHMLQKDDFAFAQINSDSTVLYMVVKKSLYAINVSDGSVVWQTDELNKRIKQIKQNETHIFLKTVGLIKKSKYLYLTKIDKADGTVIYTSNEICKNKNDFPFKWHGKKLILYADKHLYTFDHEKK